MHTLSQKTIFNRLLSLVVFTCYKYFIVHTIVIIIVLYVNMIDDIDAELLISLVEARHLSREMFLEFY